MPDKHKNHLQEEAMMVMEERRLLTKFFDLCLELAQEMSRRDYPK